jgi:hypothetical protein
MALSWRDCRITVHELMGSQTIDHEKIGRKNEMNKKTSAIPKR